MHVVNNQIINVINSWDGKYGEKMSQIENEKKKMKFKWNNLNELHMFQHCVH